jgi:hypothetical protein
LTSEICRAILLATKGYGEVENIIGIDDVGERVQADKRSLRGAFLFCKSNITNGVTTLKEVRIMH